MKETKTGETDRVTRKNKEKRRERETKKKKERRERIKKERAEQNIDEKNNQNWPATLPHEYMNVFLKQALCVKALKRREKKSAYLCRRHRM